MKQMKLSKHLRLGSNSALSNNNNSALDIPMYQPHLFVPAPVSYDGTFSSSPGAWGISAVL